MLFGAPRTPCPDSGDSIVPKALALGNLNICRYSTWRNYPGGGFVLSEVLPRGVKIGRCQLASRPSPDPEG